MSSTTTHVEPNEALVVVERFFSVVAFLASSVPVFLIFVWRDWKFTRERFVMVIIFTSFVASFYWLLHAFAQKPLNDDDDEATKWPWCIWMAVREAIFWTFVTELTCVVWYTLYCVNTLEAFQRHLEVKMHIACFGICAIAVIASGMLLRGCELTTRGRAPPAFKSLDSYMSVSRTAYASKKKKESAAAPFF
jgi:hypothetical protein